MNKKINPKKILDKGLKFIANPVQTKGELINMIKQIEAYLLINISYDPAIPLAVHKNLEDILCEFDLYYWAYEYNNQTKKQGLVNLGERLNERLYQLNKKILKDER